MKFSKLTLAIAAFAPLLCSQNTGSISGLFTNILTGAPIEGVTVRAACLRSASTHCPDKNPQTVTDNAGAYRISALPDGTYQIDVEKDGFSRFQYGVLEVARVSAGGDARFDLKLTPLASLRGRVVDPEGKPVAGITVQLGGARPTTTDDQGNFVFQKLNPQGYLVSAKVKAQPDGKDGERPVTTYFPSAIDSEQAVEIEMNGVDLSGYEIKLRTAPARTIRGVVLDADGKPRAHASIMLAKAAKPELIPLIFGPFSPARIPGTAFSGVDNAETGPEGAFEFAAVFEGEWVLRAYDSGNRQGGLAEVRVGRNDIDDAAIRLTKPFPIEITPDLGVSQESSDSEPDSPPGAVSAIPLDGQFLAGTGADADPPFTGHLLGPPGRYLFGPGQTKPGYYVSAVMLDGHDVLGQAVELAGPTALKVVFKKDGGTVSGTVEKGGGSTVVLMADATAYTRFGLTVRCDAEGNFSIPDVPPGNYTAVAFEDKTVLLHESREVLNRIDSARGERVKIEAGASETVALKPN